MIFERLSKVVVVLSALAALVFEAGLGAREWPPLLPATVGALVVAALVARIWAAACWVPVLFFAYLVPATFLATLGRFLTAYQTIWLAALLGAILGTTDRRGWTFPARWKLALAFWALVIALAWPVVIARETDFTPALLSNYHVSASGLGGPPPVIAVWILNVALTHLLGLLWFDWCFRTFPLDQPSLRFRRLVVLPLAASAFVGASVAIYQGLGDLTWLSGSVWPVGHRAAGTLLDAPGFGALAAMWTCAFLALAATATPGLMIVGIAGFVVSWGGLWATASRTALFSGGLGLVLASWSAIRASSARRRRWLVPAVVIAALFLALLPVAAHWKSVSPIFRARAELPHLSLKGVETFVRDQLWNRGAPVGTVGVAMFTEFPAVGVGVGAYNHLLPDYCYALKYGRFTFENAQNWYRHQLAELGLVGSLGWLWWAAGLSWLLVRTRGGPPYEVAAGAVKASLVGVAVISFVGMPTQVTPVALTVWILAFWYVTLSPAAQTRLGADRRPPGWVSWFVVWLVALGFAAGTFWAGKTSLRPPFRALMAEWDYERGWQERLPAEESASLRWTGANAVSVFQAGARYVKLTFRVGHPDVATRPVNVAFAFWVRRPESQPGPFTVRLGDKTERVANATLDDHTAVTWYVEVPAEPRRLMVETWIDRTWNPSASGQPDTRDLGLAISDWTFVEEPPRGAVVIK